MPLMDLVFRASTVHRQYFNSAEVQQVNAPTLLLRYCQYYHVIVRYDDTELAKSS
jgi:hypothetical protein